jgi:hypothetical protein
MEFIYSVLDLKNHQRWIGTIIWSMGHLHHNIRSIHIVHHICPRIPLSENTALPHKRSCINFEKKYRENIIDMAVDRSSVNYMKLRVIIFKM